MNIHERYMNLAIKLALKGTGKTLPNPLCGAIVVKDRRVVGKGYHKKYGGPHAEVFAIEQAREKTKNADLYVTLEPCSHFGKTPPCAEKIITSGIKRVFIGMQDPNPVISGKSIEILTKKNIKIQTGILKRQCMEINKKYIKYIKKGMPFVTLKLAQSLDGKIASFTGDSKWISNQQSRRYVHKLRASASALLVGVNTIIKDNPLLTCRLTDKQLKQPVRIVLDSKLRIPLNAKIFSNLQLSPVVIAVTKHASIRKIKQVENKGVKIIITDEQNGKVDIKKLLHILAAEMNLAHLLVEGGGEVSASFIRERLVDSILFFIAPKIIGGKDAINSVAGKGVAKIKDAIKLKNISIKMLGKDILVEGQIG